MIGSKSANKENKYSEVTMALMKERKNIQVKTQRDEIERAELNKLINKRRMEEKRKRNVDLVEENIQKGKSLKTANRKLALGKQQMISLKDDNDEIINCREQIVTRVQEFYGKIILLKY